MSGTPGLITEITQKINYCELCNRPADSEHECNVFTIEKIGAGSDADISKNIIVMCAGCKGKYDAGLVGKKHLKACVVFRDPELVVWLRELFERYDIRLKQEPATTGPRSGLMQRLINDQKALDKALLLFSAFFILLGIIMFAYGCSGLNVFGDGIISSGLDSGDSLFLELAELAGVALTLIGTFFLLCLVKVKE